jgi:hypothetical protein
MTSHLRNNYFPSHSCLENYTPHIFELIVLNYSEGGVGVKALRYWLEGPRINSRWCYYVFFRGIRQFHVPGIDSSSKNEYQVTLESKDDWCVWLTTFHFQVPMSRNLEALNSQNPLGSIGL